MSALELQAERAKTALARSRKKGRIATLRKSTGKLSERADEVVEGLLIAELVSRAFRCTDRFVGVYHASRNGKLAERNGTALSAGARYYSTVPDG